MLRPPIVCPAARRLPLSASRLVLLALLLLVAGVPSGHAAQPAADPPPQALSPPTFKISAPAWERIHSPKIDTALQAVVDGELLRPA